MRSILATACLSLIVVIAPSVAAPPPGYRPMTADEIRAFRRRMDNGEIWVRAGSDRAGYVTPKKRSVVVYRRSVPTNRRVGSSLPWWPNAPGD